MPLGIGPIQFKVLVAESSIFPWLYIEELAEVISVQLKQVRNYGLLLSRRANHLKPLQPALRLICHEPAVSRSPQFNPPTPARPVRQQTERPRRNRGLCCFNAIGLGSFQRRRIDLLGYLTE